MNARLERLGGDAESRMRKDKLKSFEQSLSYSYQASAIVKDNINYKALINPDKLKMDYDDKMLSISFNSGFAIGDIFHWTTTNTHWIIYTQQFSEDAYFRGSIRNCKYQLKWVNEFGQEKSTYAAVTGPVETKIVSDMKSSISYDTPNYTLTVLIPNNENTKNTFVRYYKLMLDGKAWEVQTSDSISMPGIIQLTLQENYKNKESDTNEIIGGKVVQNITVTSALDNSNIQINTPFELWTKILRGEESLDLECQYTVVSGNAIINDNKITLNDTDPVVVDLLISEADTIKQYAVFGVEVPVESVVLNITGPLMVKPYGTTSYSINKYVNGIQVIPLGIWSIEGTACTVETSNSTTLVLKWIATKKGIIKITYQDGIDIIEQDVIIQSLF